MKKVFYIGLIFGGILGITIALTMDILLGQTLGGGWSEAVANDMNRFFGATLARDSFAVIVGVIVVVGIIGAFGAFVGGICFVLIAHFFSMMAKDK